MKKVIIASILSIMLVLSFAGAVFATSPPSAPDSKSFESVKVFQHLAEDDDRLIVFHWNWASDNYSATPASDTMLYRLFDTDNVTELATGNVYVFPYFDTNGYGNNVGSIFFSASDNLTWGQSYKLEIISTNVAGGFSPAVSSSWILAASDYTSATTQAANRVALYDYIIQLGDRFTSLYEIVLKTSSDSGIVLSPYGELFFKGAIPGLLALCPDLFFIQVYVPEIMEVVPYDMSLQTTLTARKTGTDLELGFNRLGDFMGVSGSFAATGLFIVMSLALCIWLSKNGKPVELGMAGSILVGLAGALIVGDVLFTLVMVGALVAVMGIVWLTLLKRA